MKTPQVPTNLDYLLKLRADGREVIDVFMIGLNTDKSEMTVYLGDGTEEKYLLHGDSPSLMTHYRKAIEFSGFGPRGLGNLIHADVMVRCREDSCKAEQFEVFVSQQCLDRIRPYADRWIIYGYKILVDPSQQGLAYVIRRKIE